MTDKTRPPIVVERTYKASVEQLWELWTTKEGFASWWGPQDFRADVHKLEPRLGGALNYDMVADTPQMIAAMKEMGQPPSHKTRGTFSEFKPYERLALTHVIDFLPGVKHYESTMLVEFFPVSGGRVRMVVTLSPMHDGDTSKMQHEGFTSQLTKLDKRFGWTG
jgi:uncharacterized protein YndB with AHSA1/START domain